MIPKVLLHELNQNKGEEIVLSKKYKGLPINKSYFKLIDKFTPTNIIAIDGGSANLIDGGGWLISKVKVGIIEYNKKRKTSQSVHEYYITIINKEKYEIIITDVSNNVFSIKLPDFNSIEIDEIPAKIMKILEWKNCLELCKQKGKFILMDSSLEAENEIEQELIENVSKSENIIVGFCKTSRLRTTNGRSLLGVVNALSTKNTIWYYNPIYENEILINTYIAKLARISKFCHKVQTFKYANINQIFQVLTYFASDSETLGYPYPLVKADKIARITYFEKRNEINKIERELKKTDLIKDTYSQSFHSELDKRMYKN